MNTQARVKIPRRLMTQSFVRQARDSGHLLFHCRLNKSPRENSRSALPSACGKRCRLKPPFNVGPAKTNFLPRKYAGWRDVLSFQLVMLTNLVFNVVHGAASHKVTSYNMFYLLTFKLTYIHF